MKKIIVIVLISCIMLCGCSKEENSPQQTAPATEQTKAPTAVPTKDPIEAHVDDVLDDLQELNDEIQSEIEITNLRTDVNTYDTLVSCLNMAMIEKEIVQELKDVQAEVIINENGLQFKNISEATANAISKSIENIVGDISVLTTHKEYSVSIDKTIIKRTNPPVVPEN